MVTIAERNKAFVAAWEVVQREAGGYAHFISNNMILAVSDAALEAAEQERERHHPK